MTGAPVGPHDLQMCGGLYAIPAHFAERLREHCLRAPNGVLVQHRNSAATLICRRSDCADDCGSGNLKTIYSARCSHNSALEVCQSDLILYLLVRFIVGNLSMLY